MLTKTDWQPLVDQQIKKAAQGGTARLSDEKLWGFLKMSLAKEMKPEHYKAWVDTSSRLLDVNQQDNVVRVAVVNPYVQNWLHNNAQGQFKHVLSELFAADIQVEFIVKPELFKSDEPQPSEPPPLLNPKNNYEHQLQEAIAQGCLNAKYTWNNFVVGLSNQLAHAAATAVINGLGSVYNPLFIYGLTGTGKTHLLQSMGLAVLEKDPKKKVFYCSSELFLNEMVLAIQTRKTHEFREKYRQLDLLLIDDIQYISNWESTQHELFHTFNALYQIGKQIAFASDRPPEEIPKLMDRLRSRFQGGMVADVQLPDRETRIAILRKRAQELQSPLTPPTLEVIAEVADSSIRELEGAFNKIHTLAQLSDFDQSEVNRQYIERLLGRDLAAAKRKLQPKTILKQVGEEFNVKLREVRSSSRMQTLVLPRQLMMYLLRKELRLPYQEVARHLNRTDHTTVIHAIQKIEKMLELDSSLRERLSRIKRNF